MESSKMICKASLLNMTVLRAWRERWTGSDFGINIKKVLPRGVSGDVYNLAECILQQSLVGTKANTLVLNYLKHALCAHLVSHAAVLRRISKYEHYDRIFCLIDLMEFLESILDGVTCRHKPEESLLPGAVLSLTNWLVHVFSSIVTVYTLKNELSAKHKLLLERSSAVVEAIATNQFLMGMLYVGRHEDPKMHGCVVDEYAKLKLCLTQSNFTLDNPKTEMYLQQIVYADVQHLDMPQIEGVPTTVEPITYCIQPLLAAKILLNPCYDIAYYVSELQMVQRLKRFSNTRLFYEIIRAVFISLSNVAETSHDTMWGAFTFFKVPDIIKQLNANNPSGGGGGGGPGEAPPPPTDHIPDLVKAFEMLLEDNLLLDFMDTKCTCNIIEYLLNDWKKQNLVNEMHVKHFSARRENTALLLQNRETTNATPSIINFIIRAELPLSGILKTLSADYNKVQESLLGVLCQVLVGNSFELILSVAAVEGRIKTFVSRLIQCNENSKQVPGETGKQSVIRSTLFDVSFLMLTIIVQIYGSDVVLSENGDSFFEKWVRECMVERNKPKCPKTMIAQCDENIVDELLLSLSKPEAQLKNSQLTWQDTCMNLPAVLYHVLIAWEKETLSSADVKGILDNIKRRLFSYSVCVTSFLCAFMGSVVESEFLKPLNMIQQFLTPPTGEEMSSQENVKERLGLSFQIIRKMQNDVHPSMSNPKTRTMTLTQHLVSHQPLNEQFADVWQTITDHGWVPARTVQLLQSLLHAGGSTWLTTQLVEEIIKCKYTKDMSKTTDIVFAVLHLDIRRSTESLLMNVVPHMVGNRQGEDVNEPQLLALARLCVNCIISAMEAQQHAGPAANQKKRLRSQDGDGDTEMANTPKIRKVVPENAENSCSNDFLSDPNLLMGTEAGHDAADAASQLKEPLQSSVQYLFHVFQQFLATEEISPKIYFVYHFMALLVENGQERARPVLRLLPPNLIQNLVKIMQTDDLTVGLICRLHDLNAPSGRQSAIADLCQWRNINLHLRWNNLQTDL